MAEMTYDANLVQNGSKMSVHKGEKEQKEKRTNLSITRKLNNSCQGILLSIHGCCLNERSTEGWGAMRVQQCSQRPTVQ